MAAASVMRDFLACPVPTVGSSAACRGRLRVSWKTGTPLLTGKKTGKFSDFSRFLRKSVPKTLGIQLLTNKFPSKRNSQAVVSPNCHRFVETDPGRLIVRDGRRRI